MTPAEFQAKVEQDIALFLVTEDWPEGSVEEVYEAARTAPYPGRAHCIIELLKQAWRLHGDS